MMTKTKISLLFVMQGINNWVKTVLRDSDYPFPETETYLFAGLCG
jgi:hypothetical protein